MYRLLICFLFILSFNQIFSQGKLVQTYSSDNGLPNQNVYDCNQDSDGNMWFAAQGGLIKYNGARWEYIDTLLTKTNNNNFTLLKKDENGNIWAFPELFKRSIFIYSNSQFSQCNFIDIGKAGESLIAADISINGTDTTIVILTNKSKVFIYNGNNVSQINYFKEWNIDTHDVDILDTTVLVSSEEGMYEIDLKTSSSAPKLKFDYKPVLSTEVHFNKLKKPEILMLTNNSIISQMEDSVRFLSKGLDVFYKEYSINHLFLCKVDSQRYYFGSKFEAFRYEVSSNNLLTINNESGFTTNGATSAYVDEEKNIWITSLRGINKIRFSPFINYNSSDGLLQNEVTAIDKFPDGQVVLAHNNGLSLLDGDSIKTIKLFKNQSGNSFTRILNLEYDPIRDVIWIVSQSKGIGFLTRSNKVVFKNVDVKLGETLFMSIHIDLKGNLYFSRQQGLFLLEGNRVKLLLKEGYLNIRKIESYRNTKLILGTKKGLGIFDLPSKTIRFINTDNAVKNEVYSFYKIDNINWLVGSYNGLLFFDGQSLKQYENLKITEPVFFIERENEFLWFGLMSGALRWNPNTGEKKLFTVNEGLSGNETNRDAFLFSNGNVYVGTSNGLSIFIPGVYNKKYYEQKPRIQLFDIVDDNNYHYNQSDKISAPFNKNNITLTYNSPSFIDEELNKYVIHIKNINNGVEEQITTRENKYTIRNLEPDDYVIGVNAINANNIPSDTLYTAIVTINQPFYFESWFLVTIIIISLTITYSFYDIINRNKYARMLELEVKRKTEKISQSEQSIRVLTQKLISAQEEERERIARELHDNIAQDLAIVKSEIDNHFVVNRKTKKPSNGDWLPQKVDELLRYVREMAFFLHPNTIKQIGLINAAQSLCTEFEKQYKIKVDYYSNLSEPLLLNGEFQTNIYRVIQEGLTNIRKHSKAKNVIVIIVEKDGIISLRIEDDGVGFNMDNTNYYTVEKKMGLKSLEERIKLMNGILSIKSVEGEGTKINAQIPLSDQSNSETNSDHLSGS